MKRQSVSDFFLGGCILKVVGPFPTFPSKVLDDL